MCCVLSGTLLQYAIWYLVQSLIIIIIVIIIISGCPSEIIVALQAKCAIEANNTKYLVTATVA